MPVGQTDVKRGLDSLVHELADLFAGGSETSSLLSRYGKIKTVCDGGYFPSFSTRKGHGQGLVASQSTKLASKNILSKVDRRKLSTALES